MVVVFVVVVASVAATSVRPLVGSELMIRLDGDQEPTQTAHRRRRRRRDLAAGAREFASLGPSKILGDHSLSAARQKARGA